MKKLLILITATLGAISLSAQTFTEWQDPNVNEINRATMHSTFKIFDSAEKAEGAYCDKCNPYRLSLNGTWKFNWVENADQRPTDFFNVGYTTRLGLIWRFLQCGSLTAMVTLSM